ncbi:hypothetical protein M3194_05410 [Paenibacillus glycanilyticus]|uniref:hypothetical protein n=1 Tax=Paenibacillus glycanilyticus TaxID=126569 RepID=UPI002040A2BB|nr:hypothetical protein [Paenibacillus glycanilyticus]MCM3626796.1 hypothetical protein [Paenibacillus glycanilyticus]
MTDLTDKQAGDNIKQISYLDKVFESKRGWYRAKINGKQSMVVYESNRLGWKIVTGVSQDRGHLDQVL